MEPTSTSKTTKAEPEASTPKAAKRQKTPKPSKETIPNKAKREKIDIPVVFAFRLRLSEAERKRIHDAAGGGKASQFVLTAALAAANGDVESFKRIVATRATR